MSSESAITPTHFIRNIIIKDLEAVNTITS